MPRKQKYQKEEVLKAIKGCSTIVSTVAKRLNCDWNTASKYINKWQETKLAYENERQTIGDFTEGKLIENVKKGDLGAIKYFLSKKYKDRGYGDEVQQNISLGNTEGATLHIIIDDENTPNRSVD